MRRPLTQSRCLALAAARVGALFAPICLTAAGCSATGVSIQEPPPAASVAPAPPSKPLPPSRWVEIGATLVGPTLPGGTLVLLGGRRVVVANDGTAKLESVPAPEPLLGLTDVPLRGGKTRRVAHSRHGIYLLDDPLGPVKTLGHTTGDVTLTRIGAAPGAVAFWTSASARPAFLDLESGELRNGPDLPGIPASRMAFRNETEGAVVFEEAGLHLTRDGGKTWTPAAVRWGRAAPDDLRLVDGSVLAFALSEEDFEMRDVPVDFTKGALGPARSRPGPADLATGEVPVSLLDWIERTRLDLLQEAVVRGVPLPSGHVVVIGGGLLATVDTKTGLPVSLERLPEETTWEVRGAARSVFLVGSADYDIEASTLSRLRALAVPPGDSAPLAAFKPVDIPRQAPRQAGSDPGRLPGSRTHPGMLRVAPSGATLMALPCESEDTIAGVCVRQPEPGQWKTVRPELRSFGSFGMQSVYDSGALDGQANLPGSMGPLLDGHVVYLRGLSSAERPPRDVPQPVEGPPDAGAGDASDAAAPPPSDRTLWMVKVSPCGEETTIATIRWPGAGARDIEVKGYIEEDVDRTLRVVLVSASGGTGIVTVPPGAARVVVTPQIVERAGEVQLRGSFGVTVEAEGGLKTSTSGGRTWSPLVLPRPSTKPLALHFGDGSFREIRWDDTLTLTEVGIHAEGFVRVGWGSEEAFRPSPPTEGVSLGPARGAPDARDRVIACKDIGQGTGARLLGAEDLIALVENGAPPDTRRREVIRLQAPAGGAVAALATEGPKAARTPSTLIFTWLDASELGAAPRQARTPAPQGALWKPEDGHAWIAGERALVRFDTTRDDFIAIAMGSNLSMIRFPPSFFVSGEADVVIGADGASFAWAGSYSIHSWSRGSALRSVPLGLTSESSSLGALTSTSAAVLISAGRWAATQTVSLSAPARSAPSASIERWAAVAASQEELRRLPPCERSSRGTLFRVKQSRPEDVTIDGKPWSMDGARYELRVDGQSACLAGVFSKLVTPDTPFRPFPTRDDPEEETITDYLRFDLVSSLAEHVTRTAVRKLECKR